VTVLSESKGMNYYTPKPTSTFNPPPGFDFDGMESRPLRRPPCEHCWIPVSERLPEDYADVLAIADNGQKLLAWREDGRWQSLVNSPELDSVTHWMPLPEPPEVK
jgi:hypothetical protein